MLKYLLKRISRDKPSYLASVALLSVAVLPLLLFSRPCPSDAFPSAAGVPLTLWHATLIAPFIFSLVLVYVSSGARRREERVFLKGSGITERAATLLNVYEVVLYILPVLLLAGVALAVAAAQDPDICVWVGTLPR